MTTTTPIAAPAPSTDSIGSIPSGFVVPVVVVGIVAGNLTEILHFCTRIFRIFVKLA